MRSLCSLTAFLTAVQLLGPGPALCAAPAAAQDESFRVVLSRVAPQSPEESLKSLEVWPGFRVELVCSEPLVDDPIAIDWGPDGRLWVVEMGDYPEGELREGGASGGRVKFLEDRDQDGHFDSATVFLDGLHFPTGVMPWREGVLITCAPDIIYAQDRDDDGKADHQEVLYRGFLEGNPQHRVNSLRWGLDNWIYGSNGDSGGFVTSTVLGAGVDIHARDFRIRPDTGEMETQTGMSQYGRCRDDWGNWFGGRNLEPIWHCALEDHYLRRNPFLVPPNPCVSLMDPPTCARVYPISETLPRFNELWTMNRFTSSCGISFYRDDLFGSEFSTSFFVCEPTHNLVHRSILLRQGSTFIGRRPKAHPQTEFLASRDHWFRPTQARTGPDGALWVVDMYRLVIEHPEYIPAKWHDQLDFHAGTGKGRIYRVYPAANPPRRFTAIRHLPTVELVALLEDPNGPKRDLVQQLLVQRADRVAVGPLTRLVTSSSSAKSRLSALCTLDGLKAVNSTLLTKAMADRHAMVRRHAIRVSESLVNDSPELQVALLELIEDPDPQVSMQLAYSLGQWNDPRAGIALAQLAHRHSDDPFLIAAVMSSSTVYPGEILEQLVALGAPNSSQAALIENLLRLVLEADNQGSLALGLRQLAPSDDVRCATWRFQVLAGFVDALEYRGSSLRQYREGRAPSLESAIDALAGVFREARKAAADPETPTARRVQAVRLIGRGLDPQQDEVHMLADLLVPQTSAELQLAVVDALGALQSADLADILLENWEQHGPEVRSQILGRLFNREAWTLEVLDRVEDGTILPSEIGAANRHRLVLHSSADVRRRASDLLDPSTPEERLKVIEQFRTKLTQTGDAKNGREVFREHCSTCHRLEGQGTDIGSDLLALTDRSPETLLVAILDPNRSVEPRFVAYSAITIAGRIYNGIVAAETGNSITMIDAQGTTRKLLRADLDELASAGNSLMPEGIEKLFGKPADLLDVIAYLRSIPGEMAENAAAARPQALEK